MSDRSLNPTSYDSTMDRKTEALVQLLKMRRTSDVRDILVVGCGEGREAGLLARAFGAKTIGIDPCEGFEFDVVGSYPAELKIMDARPLSP